ncbi:uncharacterized protein LOC110191560 [Drosophila serrata]|uniref:uncharacterized protein LOC110191560 n=1 Tax=Drosophila serrata TaxID=7274 RepID=UPI000A1D0E7A|nr:uncharacterized protein LOC110191560 [Drosophila serrata]
MSQDSFDCNTESERPRKTLVLTIFALAVIMKLCIILVEILDFGNYLKQSGEKKSTN